LAAKLVSHVIIMSRKGLNFTFLVNFIFDHFIKSRGNTNTSWLTKNNLYYFRSKHLESSKVYLICTICW